MTKPESILRRYFGYGSFRPGQIDIVNSIATKSDTLALLPTGGGKSICFQVPGLMLGGTTIVVSPLISLMKDQVDALNSKGIVSTYINSSLSADEQRQRMTLFELGKYGFVYVAPEKLLTKSFISICQRISIKLLAVDEAHCISEWGHDFRPEYARIPKFVRALPLKPTVAAFTATATPAVQKDIITSLQLNKPKLFLNSFARKNLHISVITCTSLYEKEYALFSLLQQHQGNPAIVYVATREAAEQIAKLLNHYSQSSQAAAYHGGMESEQRALVQEAFIKDEITIIVATNAFGMGVDKPNVRCVIHYHLSSSLENYYQEAGRAGRDGQLAWCYALFLERDIQLLASFVGTDISPDRKSVVLQKLKAIRGFAKSNSCLHQYIMQYFGETAQKCLHACNHCEAGPPLIKNSTRIHDLFAKRQRLATSLQVTTSEILTVKQIYLAALHDTHSKEQFALLPGIGPGWLEKWYTILEEQDEPRIQT